MQENKFHRSKIQDVAVQTVHQRGRKKLQLLVGNVQPDADCTIRLKRLKPMAPDFGGPQNFGTKENFQHFCKHYIYIFVFTMPLTKDLYRRMSAKE